MRVANWIPARFSIRQVLKRTGLLLSVLLVLGCTGRREEKPLVKVDDFPIYARDLGYQRGINGVMGAAASGADMEAQLIEAFTLAAILKRNDFDLGPAAVEAEAKRIDDTTLDAAALNQIKDVFAKRREDYLRVFILPTLAKRSIYFEFFVKSETIHKEAHEKARRFLTDVMKPKGNFDELASEQGLLINTVAVTKDMDPKAWQRQVYDSLRSGQVSQKLVDLNEVILAVRRHPTEKDTLEAIMFNKRPYDPWLTEQRRKIKVTK